MKNKYVRKYIIILAIFSEIYCFGKTEVSTKQETAEVYDTINIASFNIADSTIFISLDTIYNYKSYLNVSIINPTNDTLFIDRIRGQRNTYADDMDDVMLLPRAKKTWIFKFLLREGTFAKSIAFFYINRTSPKNNQVFYLKLIGYRK